VAVAVVVAVVVVVVAAVAVVVVAAVLMRVVVIRRMKMVMLRGRTANESKNLSLWKQKTARMSSGSCLLLLQVKDFHPLDFFWPLSVSWTKH